MYNKFIGGDNPLRMIELTNNCNCLHVPDYIILKYTVAKFTLIRRDCVYKYNVILLIFYNFLFQYHPCLQGCLS